MIAARSIHALVALGISLRAEKLVTDHKLRADIPRVAVILNPCQLQIKSDSLC